MFYTLLGFLVCGLQLAVIPLMYHMGQPVEVVDMAIPYYKLLAYSMPFIMLFFTFKQFLEGVGNTRVEMVVVILCNLMNVGLNWISSTATSDSKNWAPQVRGSAPSDRASPCRS